MTTARMPVSKVPALDREVLLATWHALAGRAKALVVNSDLDGLVSGVFLGAQLQIPIVGFYDNESLWISDAGGASLRHHPEEVVWVDCSMCWPGLRSVSQHVTARSSDEHETIAARSPTLTPSAVSGAWAGDRRSYIWKYPFGLFPFLVWLLDPDFVAHLPTCDASADALLRAGLLWLPDNAHGSLGHNVEEIQQNCAQWIYDRMVDSPMQCLLPVRPAGRAESEAASARIRRDVAEPCFRHLQSSARFPARAWRASTLQVSLSEYEAPTRAGQGSARGTRPIVDPEDKDDRQELDTFLAEVARILTVRPPSTLPVMRRFRGRRFEAEAADLLPQPLAERVLQRRWASLAFTGVRKMSCTIAPGEQDAWARLADVLPSP